MSQTSLPFKAVFRAVAMGLGLATLAWSSTGSGAVIITFTDATAWAAAAGAPIALEDFTDATLVPGLSVGLAGGGSISGGMISSSLAVFGLCINGGTNCPPTTMFGFSPGTTAFGADWDLAPGGAGSGIDFSVALTAGASPQFVSGFVNPASGGTFSGFFGFVSDVSFTSISLGSGFTGNGETFDADNVRFRTVGDNGGGGGTAPEPATLVLVGAALAGLGWSKRRKS